MDPGPSKQDDAVQESPTYAPTPSNQLVPNDLIVNRELEGSVFASNISTPSSGNEGECDEELAVSSMDSQEAHRRRKAQLKADRLSGKGWPDHHQPQNMDRYRALSPEDDQGSDISISASEDVELDPLNPNKPLSDDEEIGLPKPGQTKRKRRRRRDTNLGARIGEASPCPKNGQKTADQTLLRTLFVNSLLVTSWYIFSLSISIVSGVYLSS